MSYIGQDVAATSRSVLGTNPYLASGSAGMGLPLAMDQGSHQSDPLTALRSSADTAVKQASDLSGQGKDLFGPAADYLKKILSGDRQQMLEATMPERRRVIDQYATAKKAIAEFTPRGGGQAGSLSQINATEASDLATIGSGARADAAKTGLNTGLNLESLGLTASSLASTDLNALMQMMETQHENSANRWAEIGKAAGTIALYAALA